MPTIIPQGEDFSSYLNILSKRESQRLKWAGQFKDSLMEYAEHGNQIFGPLLPWSSTHDKFRTKKGELTMWAGWSGHFKSTMVGQAMLNYSKNSVVTIASLEMPPAVTLLRMCQASAGCYPSPEWAAKWSDWSNDRIAIYDQLQRVDSNKILGMIMYAREKLNSTHVVIDSLTKVGLPADGNQAMTLTTDFIDKLQWIAKHTGVQIHLVCHCRKGDEDREKGGPPTKFDIRGPSQITDMADNVVMVWKNKRRDISLKKKKSGAILTEAEKKQIDHRPDQLLVVEKQRQFGWEGSFGLYLQPDALQFTEVEGRKYPALEI